MNLDQKIAVFSELGLRLKNYVDQWSDDNGDEPGNVLNEIFEDNGLTQLVNEPTHFGSEYRSCIDLVISIFRRGQNV